MVLGLVDFNRLVEKKNDGFEGMHVEMVLMKETYLDFSNEEELHVANTSIKNKEEKKAYLYIWK